MSNITLVSTKILSIGRVLFQEFIGHERLVIEVRRERHDAVQFVREAGGRFRFAVFRPHFRRNMNFHARLPDEPQQRFQKFEVFAAVELDGDGHGYGFDDKNRRFGGNGKKMD